MNPSGPKVVGSDHEGVLQPFLQRSPRSFRDFEPHRLLRLGLQNGSALFDLAERQDIVHFHFDEITAAPLAVECQVEKRQITADTPLKPARRRSHQGTDAGAWPAFGAELFCKKQGAVIDEKATYFDPLSDNAAR